MTKDEAAEKRSKAREAEFKGKGWTEIHGVWVEPEHADDAKKGIFWDDGNRVTRQEKLQLNSGMVRDPRTGEFIDPTDLDKAKSGLFLLDDGRWVEQKEADEYHAQPEHPWIYRTAHVTIITGKPFDQVKELASDADSGYEAATRVFAGEGLPPEQRPVVILPADDNEYRAYGERVGAEGSAYSVFYADAVIDLPGVGEVRPAICNYNKDWVRYWIRHAAAFVYVETLLGDFDANAPLWLRRGVAGYGERFFKPEIAGWFGKQFIQAGGMKDLKGWFDDFAIHGGLEWKQMDTEVYQAALLLSFAMDGGNADCTSALQAVTEAVQKKDRRDFGKAVDKLEKLLTRAESDVREYPEETDPEGQLTTADRAPARSPAQDVRDRLLRAPSTTAAARAPAAPRWSAVLSNSCCPIAGPPRPRVPRGCSAPRLEPVSRRIRLTVPAPPGDVRTVQTRPMIPSTTSFSFRGPAFGLLCAVLAMPAVAQNRFAAALPADTIAFVSFPDLKQSFQEFQQMPLAKMWREDQVQDFFADALKLAKDSWNQGLDQARQQYQAGALPFDPDELLKARLESMSFALTGLGVTPVEDADPMLKIGVVAYLDFGTTAPIWNNVLTTALDMMTQQAGDEMKRSLREVGGTQLHVFEAAKQPEVDASLNVAFVGTGVLIGTQTADVEGMLTRMQSKEAGLTAAPAYQAVAKKLDTQGAEAELYVRPGVAMDSLLNILKTARDTEPDFPSQISPEGIDRAITALGIRSIEAVGMTSSYENGRCVTHSFSAIPKAARTGLTACDAGTLDMGFLRWIPADAVSFQAGRVDLPHIYDSLSAALMAYDPKLGARLLEHLGKMEEQVGISLQKDLFGAFGNQYAFWQMPMAAFGAFPEMALIAQVKDPDQLVHTLQTIAQLSEGSITVETVERRGITVHQIRFDLDLGAGAPMTFNPADMFTPTIGFKDGYMVVGLSTGDVKRAFARMEREDDPSGDIRSNPEFAPCLKQIPSEGLSALSFTDWKSMFESYYQMVTSVLAFIPPNENIPFDLSLLPDSSTLTQHLFAAVSWSKETDEGTVVESISPFGPELVVLGGTLGLGAVGFATARVPMPGMPGTTTRRPR